MKKKYVFITGAPGSRWGRIEYFLAQHSKFVDNSAWLPYLQDNPNNLTTHQHKFYGPYNEHGERFDVLHLLGRDGIYDELDRAFDPNDPRPIRFVRCHHFAYQLDWIAENLPEVDIIMMLRESNLCYRWWHEAGGWDIEYPNYTWYGTSEKMRRQIVLENNCMLKFMRDRNLEMDYSSWEIHKWLKKHWHKETFSRELTDAHRNPPDKTCWPVVYRGSDENKFRYQIFKK